MEIEFEWDEANISHIARHGILPCEVEEAYHGDPLDIGSRTEQDELRVTYLGETGAGRLLVVVITMRGSRIRVVTSYPADRRYRRLYPRVTGRAL